jgi:hypothetical protein
MVRLRATSDLTAKPCGSGVPTAGYAVIYATVGDNAGCTSGSGPFFVDPPRADCRLKPGDGFPDIRFERIGGYRSFQKPHSGGFC